MEVRPVPAIVGALAREDGMIKLPAAQATMPNGGVRGYSTKWRRGIKGRASKTARHERYTLFYRGRNYKVHRLVCEAFYGPPPFPKAVVLHLDENALNNAKDNLRWGTQKENLNMPNFISYCKSRTGENNPYIKGRKAQRTRRDTE